MHFIAFKPYCASHKPYCTSFHLTWSVLQCTQCYMLLQWWGCYGGQSLQCARTAVWETGQWSAVLLVSYNAVQCSAVERSALQCSALQCTALLSVKCSKRHCRADQCCAVPCSRVLCIGTIQIHCQYSSIAASWLQLLPGPATVQSLRECQHIQVQYSIVQYNTIHYSTVHYSTIQYGSIIPQCQLWVLSCLYLYSMPDLTCPLTTHFSDQTKCTLFDFVTSLAMLKTSLCAKNTDPRGFFA